VSTSYGRIAEVYDRWMEDVDYSAWWRYLSGTFTVKPSSRILEAGCGTGNLTAEMSADGHQVVASDLSPAMLAQAERKLRGRRNVRFLQLDMRDLPANLGRFDYVIAACDAVNYLSRPEYVQRFISGAAALLDDGGALLFDVHGQGRVVQWSIAPHHNFVSSESCYLWRAELHGRRILHHITGFTKQADGVWQRFDELHQQRYYAVGELEAMLEAAGLSMEAALAFHTTEPYSDLSSRIQICARLKR
jgi:SAM-dependent methyltransferase